MDRFISYKEADLVKTLDFMHNELERVQFALDLMKEQREGKRDNLDMSIGERMQEPVHNIRSMLYKFGIVKPKKRRDRRKKSRFEQK